MVLENLALKYSEFESDGSKLNPNEYIQRAKSLLEELRKSGKIISNPQERDILYAWCRNLGGKIYEATGEYPAVRISSFLAGEFIPRQIPPPPADFTDRDEEISNILNSFDRGAMINGLHGMGGIGKTALALILADRLKDGFPDGQLFLDLRGMSNSPMSTDEAMAHIIQAYSPSAQIPESDVELRGMYRSALSGKRVLLLLDDVATREQVEPLMPPLGCAVLITSRQIFSLPGLKTRDLDVLHPDDAKKLLLSISERIGGSAEELAKLCGYLPLALRNAASVIDERKDIDVAEFVQKLRVAATRVKLVEASFSLSCELLRSDKRKLWLMLSIFPSDFGHDGAAAIWETDLDDATDILSELVKLCLLNYIPAAPLVKGRYRFHDLVREFANLRLDPAICIIAQNRHAKYYKNVLRNANTLYKDGGDSSVKGRELFDLEWVNIQSGQAWAESISEQWDLNPCDRELVKESALLLSNAYPNAGFSLLELRLHPRVRIRWLETALNAARQLNNHVMEGIHLANLGIAYRDLGEYQHAIDLHKQQLAIAQEIEHRRAEGNALNNLGLAHASMGNMKQACELYQQALEIAREIGNKSGEGNSLSNLGVAYASMGYFQEVIEYHEQARLIFIQIADRRGEGNTLNNLGRAYIDLDKHELAIKPLKDALAIAREIGNRVDEGYAMLNLSEVYHTLGKNDMAIELLGQTLIIADEFGNRRLEALANGKLGKAYRDLGNNSKAIRLLAKSLRISKEIGNKQGVCYALFNMGIAYNNIGRPRAMKLLEEALAISLDNGLLHLCSDIKKELAKLTDCQGVNFYRE